MNKVNNFIFYIFINIDKDFVKLWKFIGKNAKVYDNELKSYIHILNIGALSKMQIPINEKSSLNLMQGILTFQIFLNTTKSFTIEVSISDNNNGKKRILFSTCSKEFIINQMHCRIPMINIPTGIWINFSIDILSFVNECFKGHSFRSIDNICLSADCKIRRICGMRQLYTLSAEEYSQGDGTILPKGFLFPNDIKYINFNLDMNYINENLELNNIKNNNYLNKNRKVLPKTSQSKRENKFGNFINNHQNPDKENQKLNNRTKIKNKTDIKQKLNKNQQLVLKENNEFNRGSTKNIRNFISFKSLKNEQKENHKMVSTIKKNEKVKSIYNANNKKNKEKYNSKSVKRVEIKHDINNYIQQKNNNNTLKKNSNINEKLEKQFKNKENINERKSNSKNINNNNFFGKDNSDKTSVNKISQIIQINQVLINNNTNNNIIQKEELNLFNTFNYKDIESKENTLLINQSNFNNASIPEIVELDINNTIIKNNENDNINNNNEMVLIDKNNRNGKNYIKKQDQMDSLFGEKILAEINGNTSERPYTPPIQKMIPVNEDNNMVNNINNISKINESLIQNHYCDLVYDNETGALFDKKTKIYYELK